MFPGWVSWSKWLKRHYGVYPDQKYPGILAKLGRMSKSERDEIMAKLMKMKGGSMEHRDNSVGLEIGHLQKVGCKVAKLLRKECRDTIEAMYVLKATLYLLRCSLIEDGIVLDNEAQLDAELRGMIDKTIEEGE